MRTDYFRLSLVREKTVEYKGINSSEKVVDLMLKLNIAQAPEEHFMLFCLDVKGNVTGVHEISHGTISSSDVHPREIFKRILLNNASCFIVSHNHPSGDVTPSDEDRQVTERLKKCAEIFNVRFLDHVIVGFDGAHFSFANEKLC